MSSRTKAVSSKRKPLAALQDQVQHSQEAAKQEQPATVSPIVQPVMIVTGGTKDKPVRTDVSLTPAVQADEIERFGKDSKRVLQGLAANLLAGTALSREVLNADHACWSDRTIRNAKTAFFGIFDLTTTGKMTVVKLRDAWAQTLSQRSRYDAPTLQALYKACKLYLRGEGALPERISPMGKFARSILDVCNNRNLQREEQIREIRKLCEEKAEWPEATAQPQVAVAK